MKWNIWSLNESGESQLEKESDCDFGLDKGLKDSAR